ncbi:MAG: hypothetical protein GKS05_10840 [Nitrospirales bacterium]|nr:hypothetical protein [Nitrospirales bacterium]
MDTLNIIKMTCLVLLGFSCLLICILIGRQMVYHYLDQKAAERRTCLFDHIFAYLRDTTTRDEIKHTLQPPDLCCLARNMRELFKSIQSKDHNHLIELLVFLEIPDYIASITLKGPLRERLEAIASLVYFSDPRIVAFLHTFLDDSVHDIRLAAARTLIERGSLNSVDLLFEKLDLTLGPETMSLQNTFRRLTATTAPRLLEILSVTPAGPTADTIKVLIVETLGNLRYTKEASQLLPLAEDSSYHVRLAFFRCLPSFWIPSALPMISKGLEDSHWQVRAQAAHCAGQVRLTESIPWLVRLVQEEREWETQYAAGCALVTLEAKGVAALQMLAQGTSQGKEMAEKVLIEHGKTPLIDNGIPATLPDGVFYQTKTYRGQERENYV